VIDLLLLGGLESGTWLYAVDPAQATFSAQYQKDLYDRVVGPAATARLRVNCRNTRQVAAYVSALSGDGALVDRGADEPDVQVLYYSDTAHYLSRLRATVNSVIGPEDQGKLAPAHAAILTTDRAFLPPEVAAPPLGRAYRLPVALERKLWGKWQGGACAGDPTLKQNGKVERGHYGPANHALSDRWAIRCDALPPTLVLTCTGVDWAGEIGTKQEVKAVQFDEAVPAYLHAECDQPTRYELVTATGSLDAWCSPAARICSSRRTPSWLAGRVRLAVRLRCPRR